MPGNDLIKYVLNGITYSIKYLLLSPKKKTKQFFGGEGVCFPRWPFFYTVGLLSEVLL